MESFIAWIRFYNHAMHKTTIFIIELFLNQACAGCRPTRAWFLKIDPVRIVGMRVRVCVCVCVCVCVSAPKAINN